MGQYSSSLMPNVVFVSLKVQPPATRAISLVAKLTGITGYIADWLLGLGILKLLGRAIMWYMVCCQVFPRDHAMGGSVV